MNAVRTAIWLAVGFVATLLLTGCTRAHQVPHTEAMRHSSIFGFTVSPDSRWILFFERDPQDTDPSLHRSNGLMRVLDTTAMHVHRFELTEQQAPNFVRESAMWTPDSRLCVLPRTSLGEAVLIDFREDADVKLLHGRIQRDRDGRERYIDETQEIDLPAELSCSDCPPAAVIRQAVRENLPSGSRGDWAVTPDGQYLFYQRNSRTERMTIVRRDMHTGEERDVAHHKGRAIWNTLVGASYVRASPNGRWLAYQLYYSSGDWSPDGGLYLLDVQARQKRRIAMGVGYQMHWTSDSSRVYFHRSDHGLQYVQVKRPG